MYIFCDAPNPQATEDEISEIHATHVYLRLLKDGFAKIHLEISQEHRGAGKAIIRGISIILDEWGKCIVLENDMEVEPLFLEYMNKGLDAYETDKQIYGIAATSYNIRLPKWYKKDLYLLPRTESWGWATWMDRWRDVDWDVKDFEILKHNKKLQNAFNMGGNDLYDMLKNQMEGKTDTWDLQWAWHVFKKHGYFVYSRWCFQKNEGFDGSGRHCGSNDTIQNHFAPLYTANGFNIDFTELRPSCTIMRRFRKYHNQNISYIREMMLKDRIFALLKSIKRKIKNMKIWKTLKK